MILIFTLFLLLLILIFGIMNISDAFLAKRELVGIGEVAVSKACLLYTSPSPRDS